ncbi:MAG TPA: hypothetical protein DCO79_07065, partial [Spirochaeta sp.]|nr:hypothetical protein [Spirochaeta sp.]
MKIIKGTSNKYLDINLSAKQWSVFSPSNEDLTAFIGGKGLGLKIFNDRLGDRLEKTDALDEGNLLIFAMGVMLGTGVPCSARFEVITRSPLTNLMAASSCGGYFGEACKTAGWDGLIISGRSDKPLVIRIDEDGVSFEDAGDLWGQGTSQVQKSLNLDSSEGAAVIGPAGENLVKYAGICSGHRFAGRGGVGAVMGSKNIKAVVARGNAVKNEPVMPELFELTKKRAKKYISRNEQTKGFRAYGTNVNVRGAIDKGYSAVRNFRDRWNPETEKTSGEAMAERYNTKYSACRHCIILCGHKGTYPDGKMRQIPEYETNGMFGSNIENYDPDLIGQWNEIMNELGFDTISAGGTIAWAMEAAEKGVRKSELRFGRTHNISGILEDIAYRVGEGDELAEGSMRLSRKYGGTEYAMHVKGLECAAYDPRAGWGQGLGYAVYNKGGCHLGSYMIALEAQVDYMPPHTSVGKADWVVFMEDLYAGVNSLQVCQFSVYGIIMEPPIPKYLPKPLLNIATITMPRIAQALMDWSILSDYFMSITGIRMNKWDFLKAGSRINKFERRMNVRLGLKPEDDTLPARFTEEKETLYPGKNTVVPIEKMVKQYYKRRGYGPHGGPMLDGSVKAARQPLKRIYCSIIMAVLGWFIPHVACRKDGVKDVVKAFPEDFSCTLGVWPDGPSVSFRREGDRLIKTDIVTPDL